MEDIVQKIFYLFSLIFIIFLISFICYMIRYGLKKKKLQEFHKQLQSLILGNDKMNYDELSYLLSKENYFSIFVFWVDTLSKKQREKVFDSLVNLLEKISSNIRNTSISYQVHFLAFLAKYPMFLEGRSNPFISYVAECTISNHFALVDYSFLVVNRFGNSNLLRKTLLLMNQHQISHNSKLITNSLLQFQGDVQTLKDLLSKDLKKYMDCYCVACIDYFGYQKLDVTSILLTFFQDSKKDKEIHLACIRYFSQVKFKPVVPFLYEFLKNDVNSWECAAIAAKALGNYPSKETNNHLLEALGSYSWYVRNNAAESIVKNNRKDVVKEMLRQISDKYAHEALKYQL